MSWAAIVSGRARQSSSTTPPSSSATLPSSPSNSTSQSNPPTVPLSSPTTATPISTPSPSSTAMTASSTSSTSSTSTSSTSSTVTTSITTATNIATTNTTANTTTNTATVTSSLPTSSESSHVPITDSPSLLKATPRSPSTSIPTISENSSPDSSSFVTPSTFNSPPPPQNSHKHPHAFSNDHTSNPSTNIKNHSRVHGRSHTKTNVKPDVEVNLDALSQSSVNNVNAAPNVRTNYLNIDETNSARSLPPVAHHHQSDPRTPRSPRASSATPTNRHGNHSKSRNGNNQHNQNNYNNHHHHHHHHHHNRGKQKSYGKKYANGGNNGKNSDGNNKNNNNHNNTKNNNNNRNNHNNNNHNSNNNNNVNNNNNNNSQHNNLAYNSFHQPYLFENYNLSGFPMSPSHSAANFKHYQQPSSPLTSPKSAKSKHAQSIWEDPTYRLWTQHISFFMAQPTHFFGVFVTNPVFRQSVFEAGLTFHPDTDPAHPVLINLNCDRFGMAERISVLAPPAGLDVRSTNPQPAISAPSSISSSVPAPTSPHDIRPMQTVPIYLAPVGGYYGSPPGPIMNGEHGPPILIDGYTGQSVYPADMSQDGFPTTEPVNGAEDNAVQKMTELRIDGSDTESERFSDGDIQIHPHGHGPTNGMIVNHDMQKIFLYNGFHNAHRTEPLRDGRRKVVSRVMDITFPPSPICKRLSDKAKVELNEQIESLFPTITPPSDYPSKRDDLLARLRAIISREWEGAGIDVYGSAGNDLGLRSADVDMSLYMPPKAIAAATTTIASTGAATGKSESAKVILARLATIMELNGMKILSKFLDARVPVIKMYDSISNLQVDVCVNNSLAVLNTQLLKAYVDLDARFRYVCILVKYWAKRRDLNDTYHGTLSSYAYTLLVIHYLQTLDPPVLPCLQRMVNGRDVAKDEDIPLEMTANGGPELYNTYFDRSVTRKTYESENTSAVHELLLGFFHYYAYVFRYRTDLASIRLGKRTSRAERQWDEQAMSDEWEMTRNVSFGVGSVTTGGNQHVNSLTGSDDVKGREKEANSGSSTSSGEVDKEIGQEREKETKGSEEAKQGGEDKTGKLLRKRERMEFLQRPHLPSKHLFCIEDPFDIDHDLSRGMEKAAVTVIRQEMLRAYEIMAGTGDFIEACEEYG